MADHNSICCIYNCGAHYRWGIFKAMADEFDIDFCLGPDTAYTKSIKTFDYNKLPGFRKLLKNKLLVSKFYWQSGAVSMAFKPYKKYVMLGEAYCLSSWIVVILARLMGKKTICWTHGWYGREDRLKRLISKWFYNMFDEILTYNDYAAHLLTQGGISPRKLRTVGNSIDSAKYRSMRQNLHPTDIFRSHFGNDNPVLLYCGRIQKSKRLDLMIDAADLLRKQGINTNLVFIGKDDENVDLPTLVHQKGMEQSVWLYGPCYDEQLLAELFYNSAVCVSPGNVGLTAVHALSCGCPVVTHNNFPFQGPEFESIRPGVTGDFFKQFDVEDLARVIRQWVDRTPQQRARTAQEAFQEVDQKWSVEHQIEVFRSVL